MKRCKGWSKNKKRRCKKPIIFGDYCFFHIGGR